jgi:hypothetical protein
VNGAWQPAPSRKVERTAIRAPRIDAVGGGMNFVALRMLVGDRAKYFGLVFAIAFCTFLLENQTAIVIALNKALGGGWTDEKPLPNPTVTTVPTEAASPR